MSRKPVKKWKRVVKRIILLVLLLALAAGGVWFAYGQLKSEYTVTYQPYTATRGSISNALSFSGSFALIDSAAYTASSDATVKSIYVSAGDTVSKGDKLARLSNGDTFKADFDGKVNAVNFEEGDDVKAGDTILQIADFTHMSVSMRVDEYDIASVSVGQEVTVTAVATEKEFTSTISSINYISASAGSVAYYSAVVKVDVDDGIYPGMQATVTITQEEANDVVILKADALSFEADNSAYVYVQNDAGEFETKSVTVGVSNGNYVEITEGVAEGDTVYAEVEEEASTSGVSSLLSGLFGSQKIQGGSGSRNFDRSNADFSGEMPSMPEGVSSEGGFPSMGGQ